VGTNAPTVIIAVGDELLDGFTLDGNSHWLAGKLREVGWPARRIEVVGDQYDAIIASIHRAMAEVPVSRVLVCGGIGPTPDDRTFDAVATALDRTLVTSAEAVTRIESLVGRMHDAGWIDSATVSAANLRMSRIPDGARVLENRRGMAAPVAMQYGDPADDRRLFVLPGIPREMQAIVTEEMLPRYFNGRRAGAVVELRFAGIPESQFSAAIEVVLAEYPGVAVGSYPQTATRDLVIRLQGADPATVSAARDRLAQLAPG